MGNLSGICAPCLCTNFIGCWFKSCGAVLQPLVTLEPDMQLIPRYCCKSCFCVFVMIPWLGIWHFQRLTYIVWPKKKVCCVKLGWHVALV